MAKTIIQPISMSQENKDYCKKKSKKLLGRENVSGYIAVLIQKDKRNQKVEIDWSRFPQETKDAVGYVDKEKEYKKALNIINQMSDCGSYEATIIRMKEIARETLNNYSNEKFKI